MSEIGPVCDRCGTELAWHGDTLAGQGCDLSLALSDLMRAMLIGVLGERRGWRTWWLSYDRSRVRG